MFIQLLKKLFESVIKMVNALKPIAKFTPVSISTKNHNNFNYWLIIIWMNFFQSAQNGESWENKNVL